uniref:transglutaminase TgpA family protein n=1 Tax=Hylemonella sp. TaxID=2066020 RepID=UPI0035B16BEB
MKNPFAQLPRDSRDTLFLLAVIAWVLLPQTAHLPWWCTALAAGMLAWRGWLAFSLRPLPGRWWLLAALVLTMAATWATHRTLLGRDAGVTLIVVLLALKTLELRARRDAFVVFFLGFFTMLTNFFYSQSLLTAAAMLLGLMGLLTALVNSHMPAGRPSLWQSARLATRMTLLGAPIMVLLFVLFPRMAPLWGMPGDAMSGRSGLSGRMEVGQITSLALDDSIALRVRFEGELPPQGQLYFRGPVLSTFDGREWVPLQPTFQVKDRPRADLQVSGPSVRYEMTLEPHRRPWLLTLDATASPPELPGELEPHMSEELQWRSSAAVNDLLRYRAEAHTSYRHGPQRMMAGLSDYLVLPPGYNPRTLQWAADLQRETGGDPVALIERVLAQLRTGGYTYTLEPDQYGQHTADEFWFDRKAGFCEHMASAFAVLMRAAGIPARIVTGYQGGQLNSVDNYWVVRQSDAHAWTEVWLAGQGWVRVDPTASVMPGRIGSLQRLLAPRSAVATAVATAMGTVISPTFVQSVRAVWDAVNNAWNQRILNYTQNRQLDLLRALGFEAPSWEDLGYLLLGALVLASLAGAAWTRWERSRRDPWLRLLDLVRQRLQGEGLQPGAAATPRELARLLALRHDPADNRVQAIQAWLRRFEVVRYAPAGARPGADLATLRREWNELSWPS